jgi:hypothetical protein
MPTRKGAPLRPEPPVPVVLYTRAGCHLCEVMKAELRRARSAVPYELREVDVDTDPELARLHGQSVPVLLIDGRPAFKVKLTAAEFARKLERRAGERRGASR